MISNFCFRNTITTRRWTTSHAGFIKAAEYINENSSFAFVSTNSICQGNHVPLLWPHIFRDGINQISFAVKDFKWTNNAKCNAGVTCSIVGVNQREKSKKKIFTQKNVLTVENINAYLIDGKNLIVEKRIQPLSQLPKMVSGNMALDDGQFNVERKSTKSSFG